MTKKDSELNPTTTFDFEDILAVTTGMPSTPVTEHIEILDFLIRAAERRTETVVIEVLGFEEEPEVGVVEDVCLSLPFAFEIVGLPYAAIEDEIGGVASSSGPVEIDMLKNGTSILSTNITIDQGELNSSTAATPPVVDDEVYAAFDQYTFEIIDAGVSVMGPLKVMFEFRRT